MAQAHDRIGDFQQSGLIVEPLLFGYSLRGIASHIGAAQRFVMRGERQPVFLGWT